MIHIVPVSRGAPRRVVTLARGQSIADLSFSPDGTRLLYGTRAPATLFLDVDLDAALGLNTRNARRDPEP
jgi:hypothetical protein